MSEDKKDDALNNSEDSGEAEAQDTSVGEMAESGSHDSTSEATGRPSSEETRSDNSPPRSQAALDLEAMEGETMAAFGPENDAKPEKPTPHKSRFRWIFLMVISLLGTVSFAAEAFWTPLPYKWLALVLLAVSLIVNIGLYRFFSLPNRAGLSALICAFCFFIAGLYGPPEKMFGLMPASLSFAVILILIGLWLIAAIGRKVGLNRKTPSLVLWVITLYALLAPVSFLVTGLIRADMGSLVFNDLSSAPGFLTFITPWFIWPMSFVVAIFLPMAAVFALWDQVSLLKRGPARHAGDFLLALAFIVLIPYAFLSYGKAKEHMPGAAQAIKNLAPIAGPAEIAPTTPPAAVPNPPEEEPQKPVEAMPAPEAVPAPETLPAPPQDENAGAAGQAAPQPIAPEQSQPAAPDAQELPVVPAPPAVEGRQPVPQISDSDRLSQLEQQIKDLQDLVNRQSSTINDLKDKVEAPAPAPSEPADPNQEMDPRIMEPNPLDTPHSDDIRTHT